jgi:hypothetical protein
MMNIEKFLRDNGLDFRVEKLPLHCLRMTESGVEQVDAEGMSGLYNTSTGKIITTCKDSYHITQTDEIVSTIYKGAKDFGEVELVKGFNIKGGARIMLQFDVHGRSKVADDTLKRSIYVTDSNDGSSSLGVGFGDLTMSCQNQFMMFKRSSEFRFKHSKSLVDKIKYLPDMIQSNLESSMRLVKVYNDLSNIKLGRDTIHNLVQEVLGYSKISDTVADKSARSINIMEDVYTHIDKEIAQKGKNLWGLHSGITSYTTHAKSAPNRRNGRIESISSGSSYRMNKKSLETVSSIGDLVLEL